MPLFSTLEPAKILIDAGFSGKQIGDKLKAIGESIDSLDAVFLSHEHSDHAQGIRGISQRKELPSLPTVIPPMLFSLNSKKP